MEIGSLVEAATGGSLWVWVTVGLLCVAAVVLLFVWRWYRRPARALRAIATAAARQQGTPPALAARLDAWTRACFKLARVEAAMCPPGLDPAAWSEWATALEQLRFAPPQPDGFEVLRRLCESARSWGRHV